MENNATVEDIMTKEVVTVHPETSIMEAYDLLIKHQIDGMPVVDGEGVLKGILTEADLLVKGSGLHLPTFQKLISEIKIYRKDKSALLPELEELKRITVADVMNGSPITLPKTASIDDVLNVFREHHQANPIPVIDDERKVLGVVSRFDLLKPLQELQAARN